MGLRAKAELGALMGLAVGPNQVCLEGCFLGQQHPYTSGLISHARLALLVGRGI